MTYYYALSSSTEIKLLSNEMRINIPRHSAAVGSQAIKNAGTRPALHAKAENREKEKPPGQATCTGTALLEPFTSLPSAR